MAPWIIPVIEFLTEIVRLKRAKKEHPEDKPVEQAPSVEPKEGESREDGF